MPELPIDATRLDPYKNFRFRIKWDGRYVAGINHVSALTRTTDVTSLRSIETAFAQKIPGVTNFQPITLERGLTLDQDFEAWANLVLNAPAHPTGPAQPVSFRKDIRIELSDEAGQLVLAYNVFRCWVSEYSAIPELDGAASGVAIERITLQNEGWQRDTSVIPPAPPVG